MINWMILFQLTHVLHCLILVIGDEEEKSLMNP